MQILYFSALGVCLAMVPTISLAQVACCDPPPVVSQESCRPTEGLLGCHPLGVAGWVALSGEVRVRGEAFNAPDFSIGGDNRFQAIAARTLLRADIVPAPGWRIVTQLSAADVTGRRPRARPFDESQPDLAQGYVDVPLNLGNVRGTVRAGRQELALGNRLVALRDGVTLRRAFDGVRVDIAANGLDATLFSTTPVDNRDGAFDDRSTPGERFNGIVLGTGKAAQDGRWTAFVLDRKRRGARYAALSGDERRQTWGAGYARTTATFDFTAQAAWQGGQTGGTDVSAWGGAIDLGWRPQPATRVGFAIGYASGDRSPADGRLTTFDPLYPNLGAFTDAPLSYYSNQIDAQLNVSHAIGDVVLRGGMTLLARAEREDALYTAPGRPLARSSGNQLSAVAFEAGLRWRIAPRTELQASVLHAQALDGIRAAGGRNTNFAMLQLTRGF